MEHGLHVTFTRTAAGHYAAIERLQLEVACRMIPASICCKRLRLPLTVLTGSGHSFPAQSNHEYKHARPGWQAAR